MERRCGNKMLNRLFRIVVTCASLFGSNSLPAKVQIRCKTNALSAIYCKPVGSFIIASIDIHHTVSTLFKNQLDKNLDLADVTQNIVRQP